MFILTLRDNEKHFYIVLHRLLRRVFCSPCRVLVGRSGRARGVYQWRKEEKADGGTEARRLPWGECSRGHRMMKSSMMRMNVSLVSTVKSSAKSALHTHVLSSGELGVPSTRAQDKRRACCEDRPLSVCPREAHPSSHTTRRSTLINLASKVLKTNHDSCWRLPWGDSEREDYTAKQREKLEHFCPSFSIQKLHYLRMLPPALFSVFESSDDLSLPLNFCVILFLYDLFLGIHWPSHDFYHLFIPSIQQRYMELNIKHRIFFRFDKGKSVSDYIFCSLYKIFTKIF